MPIPERPRWDSCDPRFRLLRTDDGSLTLQERTSGDTFHSGCGAVAECDHVYLRNSQVATRLVAQQATRVLELGFGTGLSFVRTASLAAAHGAALDYVALESRPLGAELMREVLLGPQRADLSGDAERTVCERLVDWWKTQTPESGFGEEPMQRHTVQNNVQYTWTMDRQKAGPEVTLRLIVGRAEAILGQWQLGQFDAIFFDPFSPASNPELWQPPMFVRMWNVLRPGGHLVSYCVNGVVRRGLEASGFEVDRVPGPPGGKREVLVATRPAETSVN